MTKTEPAAPTEGRLQSTLTPASGAEPLTKAPKAPQPKSKVPGKGADPVTTASSPEDIKPIVVKTLPEILKGIAAVLTAIGGIITVLLTTGIIHLKPEAPPLPSTLLVVSTEPADGAVNVDPSLTKILIEFNQPVNQESWSFVLSELGEYPPTTGDPYFSDEKTCVLPVKLEPGKTYGIGVNSPSHRNFVSAADETISAEPYQFSFTTKP